MRYNINARLIYDATDGTLTLPGNDEPDSQLSITASALLYFFLRHTGVVSRDEVLKKVWDDNGLTSSNSNLNQYLSMLRKTFRHYDIDNIIVTVSRGMLQLNQDLSIELLDAGPALTEGANPPERAVETALRRRQRRPPIRHMRAECAGIWPAAACWSSPCFWWHSRLPEPTSPGQLI